ncbi:viperin family antiviral radical SAM protein [Methanolapillus millepedarum]|uniref:GTP 3',8-cyclase n=1 Tax=Methanolapillus millepedarum TaxID=3028296 RepID=A0AA96ZVW4_9EURY|nr:GTP 3',8-cyclase [Methanosarcinaceae archaeon Ac7]
MNSKIRSANWHITSRCNYKCQFCFAKEVRTELRDEKKQEEIIRTLRDIGIEKLNIVGGEPQMHPDFDRILRLSKDYGLTTTLQTNGSFLTPKNVDYMAKYLDWIGLSIDSGIEMTELQLGRGPGNHVNHIKKCCSWIHSTGVNLKINSTITSLNWDEDLHDLINELSPHRWKVFRTLILENENAHAKYLCPTDEEFHTFVQNHSDIVLRNGDRPVFEDNEDMIGSYLMISPDGKLQTNINGRLEYFNFENIIKMNKLNFIDIKKYFRRGAIYEWHV